jgi:hypothetical protein
MHTFQGRSNQVAWTLHLVGEIPKEHGIKEEYPLMVLPALTASEEVHERP